MEKAKKSSSKKTSAGAPLSHGVGRRKSAVARVWLRRGTGKIVVNGRNVDEYFDTAVTRQDAKLPLAVSEHGDKINIDVNVNGGGVCSQAGAVRLGIARAMVAHDETIKPLMRKNGLITVDARNKERKKYGQRGARRKFQFVKR